MRRKLGYVFALYFLLSLNISVADPSVSEVALVNCTNDSFYLKNLSVDMVGITIKGLTNPVDPSVVQVGKYGTITRPEKYPDIKNKVNITYFGKNGECTWHVYYENQNTKIPIVQVIDEYPKDFCDVDQVNNTTILKIGCGKSE